MGKVIRKKSFEKRRTSFATSESRLEGALVEHNVGSSFLKRRKKKKPSTKYEQVKLRILEEQRVRLEDESEAHQSSNNSYKEKHLHTPDHAAESDDLLFILEERNNGIRQAFAPPKESPNHTFSQLKFADPHTSKHKTSTKSESLALQKPLKNRDFLLINGEKIFFDQNTISSILNVDRIKRLTAYKNNIGSSGLDKSSLGLKN